MAFTRIQGTTGTTGATFPTSLAATAFATTPVGGNFIIVGVLADGLAKFQQLTVTDNAGNAYVRLGSANINAVDQVDIWAAWSIKGVASHVITAGNLANTTAAIIAEEWSGAPSCNSFDQLKTATDNTGTSTAVASGSTLTTQYPNELLWSATFSASSTVTATVGAGYSNLTSVTSSPSKIFVQSQVVAATGTQSAALTLSAGSSWGTVLVTISDTAFNHKKWLNSGLRPHPFSPGLAR